MSRRRAVLLDLGWSIAFTGIASALVAWGGGIWFHVGGSDLHGYFLPKYEAVIRALFVEHRLPLWNPYDFCGVPLFGTHQANTFYPPLWLTFGLLSARTALQVFYAFHFFVLAWSLTTYLRRHDVPRPVAGLGVLVVLAGVFTGRSRLGIDHPSFLACTAWLPAILVCWENAARIGVRPWLGWLSLAVAAQWLAGYPDFSLDSAVLLGVLALVGGIRQGGEVEPPLLRRLLVAAAGFGLGSLLVAVQLLPTRETVAESMRAMQSSLAGFRAGFDVDSAADLLRVGVGRYGLAALALVAASLIHLTRTRLAWLAALLWATFAVNSPLNLLYLFPPFATIRFPFGWEHLAPIFLAALACAAVAHEIRHPASWRRVLGIALAIAAAGSSATTIAESPVALAFKAPDYPLVTERAARLRKLYEQHGEDVRLISSYETLAGVPLRERMRFAAGYEPAIPPYRIGRLVAAIHGRKDLQPTTRIAVHRNPRLAALLGVGLVVVPSHWARLLDARGLRRVGTLPPDDVILFQEPMPRARIVHRVFVEPEEEANLERTIDRSRDLRGTVVLEEPLENFTPEVPSADAAESARIVASEPERVVVEARLETPGLLVLNDTHFPGWEAWVDGVRTPIVRADYAFRAVPLPAGKHEVVFRFRPRSLAMGAALTALSALAVLWLLWPRAK